MPQCPLRRHSNVRCYADVGLVILWKLASWSEVTLDWWCLWYAYFDSELSKLWTCLHGQAILKETIRHVTLVAITGTAITVPHFKSTQVTANYFKIENSPGVARYHNKLQWHDYMTGYQDSAPSNGWQNDMPFWEIYITELRPTRHKHAKHVRRVFWVTNEEPWAATLTFGNEATWGLLYYVVRYTSTKIRAWIGNYLCRNPCHVITNPCPPTPTVV